MNDGTMLSDARTLLLEIFTVGTGDANGVPRVHYSYRSLHGAFFDCESRSLEEAQHLCEDWLVGQDRCYRN